MGTFDGMTRAVTALAVTATFTALWSVPASGVSRQGPVGDESSDRLAEPVRRVAQPVEAPPGGAARWLVRYAPGTDMAAAARTLRSDGVTVRHTVTRAVDVAVVSATAAEVAAVADSPGVLAVEPDAPVHATGTQVDPPWGLDRIDQRSLPFSSTFTTPEPVSPVHAYVVDTGVRASHVELAGRVAAGFSAVADGPATGDCNGHGTHVAGTLAGSGTGVAKTATVVPVRVLNCAGVGDVSDVILGLDWLVGHHQAGVPAVANLSLGSPASGALDAAAHAAVSDGVTLVTGAGNETADACGVSPARLLSGLTVAASDDADAQASFSNDGSCVDLHAPGVAIVSSWWLSDTTYAEISGTSMAAPHVAGAAAVLLARQPGLSPAQVGQRLLADATPGVVTGVSVNTPNRLLFLDQYEVPAPPPPPPTTVAPPPVPPTVARATAPARASSVSARPRVRAVRVRWVLGADGGSPLVDAKVRVYRQGERVRTVTVPPDATRARVTRLRAGVAYRFSVVVRNAFGTSPESARSRSVRPRA